MSEASKLIKMCELVHIPIPFLDNLEWAVAKAIASDKKLEKAIPLQTVQTAELQPTQFVLNKETLKHLAKEGNTDGQLVFERRDKKYVYDGHHRLQNSKNLGKKTVRVRLLKLSDDKPMSLKWFAAQFGVESRAIWQAMDSSDRSIYEKDL